MEGEIVIFLKTVDVSVKSNLLKRVQFLSKLF